MLNLQQEITQNPRHVIFLPEGNMSWKSARIVQDVYKQGIHYFDGDDAFWKSISIFSEYIGCFLHDIYMEESTEYIRIYNNTPTINTKINQLSMSFYNDQTVYYGNVLIAYNCNFLPVKKTSTFEEFTGFQRKQL